MKNMNEKLAEIIDSYDPTLTIERALSIPSSWYTNQELYQHRLKNVFSRSWQMAARLDQLEQPGQYVTADVAGEPLLLARGNESEIRGDFNDIRHHSEAVMS